MSIKIEVRKDNRIVILNIDGKVPIRTRSGSFTFHNSMELLCMSYGSCFGRSFLDYCKHENINPETFESLILTMENNIIYLTIQHPKNITDEIKNDIKRIARICEIAKLLVNLPVINFIENNTSTETLINNSLNVKCCGQ